MTRYRLFGDSVQTTDVAREILAEDIAALRRRIATGWDIDAQAELVPGFWELPLSLALVENKLSVLRLLVEHGVNLNDRSSPAIVTAAHNCDAETLAFLVAHGARVDAYDRVGKNAYQAALYSERLDLLPVLLRLGLRPDADGGVALRQAAFARQLDAVKFFIEHGVDPNGHVSDAVMPNNPTAVAVAARNGDLDMVRYLVEHGADVTLKDEYGDRPYSHAVAIGHAELQSYLKALEPPAWHDVESRLVELRPFKLPDATLAFLRGDNRRVDLVESPVRFIEFHGILGVKPILWRRRRFLDLLAVVDNYWEVGFLAWSGRDRKLVHVDFEHDELRVLCTWPEFVADPGTWIRTVFE
jgi:hypothetical protein